MWCDYTALFSRGPAADFLPTWLKTVAALGEGFKTEHRTTMDTHVLARANQAVTCEAAQPLSPGVICKSSVNPPTSPNVRAVDSWPLV
eukprot:5758399-Amphidinium_carterae.1